jgi:D-2-hydroxyacid dehydrogenase (NADP+)
METINVLISGMMHEEDLKRITDISPRIKIMIAADLFRNEMRGDTSSKEKLDAMMAEAEVIAGFVPTHNIVNRAPKLKWIQISSAGVERFITEEIRNSSIILTNASGIHAVSISEFVLQLMLMFVKQAPLCLKLKQEKQWKRLTSGVLRDKTVGVIGLGNIGKEVARLSKAFGMRVLAVDADKKPGKARNVDMVSPPSKLIEVIRECDFVVTCVPLTPATAKMIGEKEFKAMKPTAYFINIARGGIVDEDVMIRALEEKWIAGAGLDVFATEPLPVESKLWEMPNAILSFHISGTMENYFELANELFLKNLKRYVEGKKLFNVVDKAKGY